MSQPIKTFTKKAIALKHLEPNQILCNNNIKTYFILDNYTQFANLILSAEQSPSYYEFIREETFLNMFIDIEIYKDKHTWEFQNSHTIVSEIKAKFAQYISETSSQPLLIKTIVLQSHSSTKRSYHVVFRVLSDSGEQWYFRNVKETKAIVKNLWGDLVSKKIIDPSVYREGLFRTYLSTKQGENRPLVKCESLSDNFLPIETFVGYTPQHDPQHVLGTTEVSEAPTIMTIPDDSPQSEPLDLADGDKDIIKRFVRKNYKYRDSQLREVFIDRTLNCIVVALDDTFCHNIDREHKSNHQYIVIDTYSSKQKCHDLDCKDFKLNEIKIINFPKEINEIILKCLKVNRKEQELIEKAIQDCKDYITNNFDENINDIQFDRAEMVFKGNASENKSLVSLNGKCAVCKFEHRITNDGYCIKCKICDSIYPKNQLIPLDDKYKNLNTFWTSYTQLVNNGTIINNYINNYYNSEEEFSCDIQLDNSIFRSKELTKIYNQILDGHKVVKISELMSKLEVDFKYTAGEWYYFNGAIWKMDKESLEFRKRIVKLSGNFNRIQQFYETRSAGDTSNSSIIKNIKSLINKLHKTGFEDEVIKGAKMYYNDESFIKNLNSKKHLVPFTNGVYDLLENKFRKTTKEDWINLILGYDYDEAADNREVHQFINKVLPNEGVRDYVLKKMSECLNGDIPNTNFLMFIGDGANGKSQLLNLMKVAMGELAEKVEVTLLTRKRNNANEANSEKIKLMNKRFAFLSEPEDGEKINIGLLKELTGSEEIVARGLYQESVSFVMEAKLFLACNELPEIKGEDTALWRRIRVIDFPSRFVDDPVEDNEYKIDRTLPSRMREDITWRQTFIKILLEYYYKDVREPVEVQVKTNEYRQENNDFYTWLEENISYKEGGILKLEDVCMMFLGKKIGPRSKTKFKKEIEKFVKTKFPVVNHQYQDSKYNETKYKGWLHLSIIDSE